MINSNWSRWIMASSAVYFKQIADLQTLALLVEGIDDREPEKMHYNHAELRVNGPFIIEPSRNYYILDVDINILLTEIQSNKDNAYDLMTWCGMFQNAMDGPINVYRYGNEEGDDGAWVGCLVPRRGRYDSNRVLHFGQMGRTDRVRQSQVDGRFKMELYTM